MPGSVAARRCDHRLNRGPATGAKMEAMSPVVRFLLGSLAAMAVVVVGLFFALRSVTIKEAERDTRDRIRVEGALVEAAGLTDGVLHRDTEALAKLDDLVQAQVLSDSVVRVKLWSRDGTILYSD